MERDDTAAQLEEGTEFDLREDDPREEGSNQRRTPPKSTQGHDPDARTRSSVSPPKTKPKNRKKKSLPLPPMGAPGGLDDPLRRGLSGAGVRWYLRFLHSGMNPEEARRCVDVRRAMNESQMKSEKKPKPKVKPFNKEKATAGHQSLRPGTFKSYASTSTNYAGKSSNYAGKSSNYAGKSSNYAGKSSKYAGKSSNYAGKSSNYAGTYNNYGGTSNSYAGSSRNIKVTVMPRDYPYTILSGNELNALEEALVEEMAMGWTHKIEFEGINFKSGLIIVNCSNEQTAEWLMAVAPSLKGWRGVELMAKMGVDYPKPYTIVIFLPRSAGQDLEKSVALIDAQNEGLNTAEWRVLKCRDKEGDQILTIGIDTDSMDAIILANYTLHYRFSKVHVHTLKNSLPL